MFKSVFVLFAVLAAAFGLGAGLIAVLVGETSVPAVALAILSGLFLAAPASWYIAERRHFC